MDLSAKLTSIQEYPFVLKREADRLKIYCPDLDVTYDELPIIQNLKPSLRAHYFQMLGIAVLKAWQKGEKKRDELIHKNKNVPSPSQANLPTTPAREPLLSPVEIARRMGCHKDTVRRAIDRGELGSQKTPGGHRKVTQSLAEKWIRETNLRPKGRPALDV